MTDKEISRIQFIFNDGSLETITPENSKAKSLVEGIHSILVDGILGAAIIVDMANGESMTFFTSQEMISTAMNIMERRAGIIHG